MSNSMSKKKEDEEKVVEDLGPKEGSGLPPITDKEELQLLYQKLKDLGINSIGDLEVKISRL